MFPKKKKHTQSCGLAERERGVDEREMVHCGAGASSSVPRILLPDIQMPQRGKRGVQ